jgi:hypothetical protein
MDIMADYGLWQLVIVNSLIILIFAFGFFQPQTKRDWRTFGAFSAFVVALFTEMYGFPLTIYLLSGWLTSRFPEINWFSHNSSHLLQTLLGWSGDAHKCFIELNEIMKLPAAAPTQKSGTPNTLHLLSSWLDF